MNNVAGLPLEKLFQCLTGDLGTGTNSTANRDLAFRKSVNGFYYLVASARNIPLAPAPSDYCQADLIDNKANQQALELAMADYVTCAQLVDATPSLLEAVVRSTAAQTLAVSDADVQVTLAAMKKLVHILGPLPGQRTLFLVSPGFPTYSSQAMAGKSEIFKRPVEF